MACLLEAPLRISVLSVSVTLLISSSIVKFTVCTLQMGGEYDLTSHVKTLGEIKLKDLCLLASFSLQAKLKALQHVAL